MNTININKKIIPVSCPNEKNMKISHPKIFLTEKYSTCKYCNTSYNIIQ